MKKIKTVGSMVMALAMGLSLTSCAFMGGSSGGSSGDLSGGDAAQVHKHTLTFADAVSPTCEEEGSVAYYECKECHKRFSDSAAEEELSSVTVPAFGHTFVYQSLGNDRHVASCLNCDHSVEEDCKQEEMTEGNTGHFYKSSCACGEKKVFDSLPKIYITTETGEDITGNMNNKPAYTCTISVESEEQSQYNLSDKAAQVKVRGNYTASEVKKPYRIKFDKKQKMLGLDGDTGAKSWVLLADYKDPSKLRNATAFYLGEQILGSDGYYVSDYRHVEVYVNGNSKGLYLLCDQQQTGSFRVDITEPEDGYEGTDIGYLVEMDGYAPKEAPLEKFQTDYGKTDMKYLDGTNAVDRDVNVVGFNGRFFENWYSVKSDIYSQAQNDFINKTIGNVFKVVYDAVYSDHTNPSQNPYITLDANNDIVTDTTIHTAREAVERVVELSSLVDTYILNEICMDMDVGWSSFRMSIDMGEGGSRKLVFQAPWDWDSAFGYSVGNTEILLCANAYKGGGTPSSKQNPWLLVLVGQDWFWEEVYAKWSAVKETGAFDEALTRIDLHTQTYVTARTNDNQLWSGKTSDDGSNNLKSWLSRRLTWLDAEFARLGKSE